MSNSAVQTRSGMLVNGILRVSIELQNNVGVWRRAMPYLDLAVLSIVAGPPCAPEKRANPCVRPYVFRITAEPLAMGRRCHNDQIYYQANTRSSTAVIDGQCHYFCHAASCWRPTGDIGRPQATTF